MIKVYHASAGSGKTFQLTKEYIRLLFEAGKKGSHRNILAVTFTNKATEEMKFRILEELHSLATGQNSPYRGDLMKDLGLTESQVNSMAQDFLIHILHDYSAFSISTIDKFFQQIIRAFARDIGVNGSYALELNSSDVLEQAIDNLFSELSDKENRLLLEWLTQYAEESIEETGQWNLRGSIVNLGREIFKENYQHRAEETNRKLHDREFLKAYREELHMIIQNFSRRIETHAKEALRLIDDSGLTPESFKGGSKSGMKSLHKFLAEDYKMTATFIKMTEDENECYKKGSPDAATIIAVYNSGLHLELQSIRRIIEKDVVSYNTAKIVRKHLNTLGIISDIAMQIRKLTTDQNIMLIADANLMLNKIIDDSDSPFIYEKTGNFIRHFMIDEFQDTSVLQWKNFLPLLKNSIASGDFNLVVGDVKQSIYRWRNSDWKLLESQVYKDFHEEELGEETLGTNWRSDQNIVQFNNELFHVASGKLQQLLNDNLAEGNPGEALVQELEHKISNAYADVNQQIKKNANEGCVRFHFMDTEDSEDEENWKSMTLKEIPALLEDFQDRGYKPCDVAILVRKNVEVTQIVNTLLDYKNSENAREDVSYDIMGSEGLLLTSSPAIRFIIGIMQLMIQPDNQIQQVISTYEYARACLGMTETEAIRASFDVKSDNWFSSSLFSQEEKTLFTKIRFISLYEMTIRLIEFFRLDQWHGDSIFIQAFLDQIHQFSTGKTTDLNSFLEWWERSGSKQSISTPENEQAFKIMTIHKSKGLDFKAVIIPFCDWDLDSKMKNIVWCSSSVEPFNQIPLMPVDYSSKLGNTVFASQYYLEKMHNYIDNLNLAYVAFTRARHEMVIFSSKPKRNKQGSYSINSIGKLIYACLEDNSSEWLATHFSDDQKSFQRGNFTKAPETKKESSVNVIRLTDIPSAAPGNRLKVKHQIGRLTREEKLINENPIDYGNIMHELLYRINKPADEKEVIAELMREGRINSAEAAIIEKEMAVFWSIPETAAWFADDVKALNETTILTQEGEQYRPDRILIDGNKATVIDYKFGQNELASHQRQITKYKELLQQMGYTTSAHLCYVKLQKVTSFN